MVKRELLIMVIQQITDMFSIVNYNLRAWFVSGGKLRKSVNYCSIELSFLFFFLIFEFPCMTSL